MSEIKNFRKEKNWRIALKENLMITWMEHKSLFT